MSHSVEEINQKPDPEPDEEANPRFDGQAEHERGAKNHAEKGEEGYPGHAEGARSRGISAAQDDNAATHEDKGKEGADVGQIGERPDVGQHGHAAHGDPGPDGCDIWGAETLVDARKIFREQTVARHGHEDARLPELEDEKDRG